MNRRRSFRDRVLGGLDPRAFALRFPRCTVVLFFCATALFVFGNIRTQKGGILENAILNEHDPALRMDQYVQSKASDGFRATEFVPFIFRFGRVCERDDLRRVVAFTDALELEFGDRVLSLARAPHFRDVDGALDDTPHLTREALADHAFDIAAWKKDITEDASVFGTLIGRDFTWAAVLLYLEPGYDQTTSFRSIVSFLEGRVISPVEWFWKRSINPTDPTIGVGGWVMGRGMIDQTLNVDVLTLVAVGLCLVFVVFWRTLGSVRLALIATLVIMGSAILWVRGSIGLLSMLGWDVHERVYVLLAYANCIVQGVSFALHRFEGLSTTPGDMRTRLRATQSVDRLIAVTATIALFGFVTLWWFAVLPVRELGVLSALGVVYLFVLTSVVSPAFLLVMERWTSFPVRRDDALPSRLMEWTWHWTSRYVEWMTMRPRHVRHRWAWALLVVPVVIALLCVFNGKIVAKSRALEYIRGTLIEETARFLNEPRGPGFDYLDVLVEPKGEEENIDDPAFLRAAIGLTEQAHRIHETRETFSILEAMQRVSLVLFGYRIPKTDAEAREAWSYVMGAFSPAIREQLWYHRGIRLSISMEMDDSVALGRFIERIQFLELREQSLRVTPFGQVPLYPQVDQYIRVGKPMNAFTSQVVIVMIAALWLWTRRRRGQTFVVRPLLGGIVMSAPFVFAGAVMMIMMAWWDIPLDISTAAITALAINAAIDFSIYLMAAFDAEVSVRENPRVAWRIALMREGGILFLDALMNALCFAPLLLSHFEPPQRLGWLMGAMLVSCAFGTLIVMASVLPECIEERLHVRRGARR